MDNQIGKIVMAWMHESSSFSLPLAMAFLTVTQSLDNHIYLLKRL